MSRFFTCHWQNRFWRSDINREYEPVRRSGSNSFRKRRIAVGDCVYIVTLIGGRLYLGGRMTVRRIMSRSQVIQLWNYHNLYDAAEWVVDNSEVGGTPLNLHRFLDPKAARKLRFVSPRSEPKGLFFVSKMDIDPQATRGVRELTPESAALLDQAIEITDQLPQSAQLRRITLDMLGGDSGYGLDVRHIPKLPEEVPAGMTYHEGSCQQITVNRYERDQNARKRCINRYGAVCFICRFDFGIVYGPAASGFIHVHHLKPLSQVRGSHTVNAVRDLRPVCPNCHAFLHLREPPYSIEDARRLIEQNRSQRHKPQ